MKRYFWKWVAVFAALAGICGIPALAFAQDTDKIDLAEITRRLTQWRSSFVNLRMVYESRSLETMPNDKPLTEWPAPANRAECRLFVRTEWIWADHGLDLLEDRFFPVKPLGIHNIDVFNGPKGVVFRAKYMQSPEGREELKFLMLRDLGVGKPISMKSRVAIEGLYLPGLAAWLPEILAEGNWTVEAIEEVGGERCARIVQDGYVTSLFWLDLNHDCLVRRKLLRINHGTDYVVDEFQRLENGIWFPKRGRVQLQSDEPDNQLWEITEVVVNTALDLSRFEPPQPAVGTTVDDGKGNVYAHGVAASVNPPGATTNASGTTTPLQLTSPSATPPTSTWLWWSSGLAIVSLLFLVTGFWFLHRS